MKKSEVDNKHKNKDGKMKNIYPFDISSAIYSQMEDYRNTNPESLHVQ